MTDDPSAVSAIAAALKQNWDEAIRLNVEIIKKDKASVEALNRLGFAYLKKCSINDARLSYQKVLKLDPYNQIAQKNLERIGILKSKSLTSLPAVALSPLTFLEEPGKTKIVECVNIAPISVLSAITCGQNVVLKPKNHTVEVRTDDGTYLGALPDDLSFRLIKLTAAGNTYKVIVKSVNKKKLMIFLRETKRGKKYLSQPSFVGVGGFLSYDATDARKDKPDASATGEDDDEGKADEV